LNAVACTKINGELVGGGTDLVGLDEFAEVAGSAREVAGHPGVKVTEVVVVVFFYVHG
jgi:hypothetical protein